ncbi:MAG: VCBS repeat-containing protein [Pirellulaceae bacterium]
MPTLKLAMTALLCLTCIDVEPAAADELKFDRVQLSDQFYSEGGTFGDFNGDGRGDVAVGPWIYWGPNFESNSRFYEGEAVDPVGYSKNFFMYSGDANDDGHRDIYVLGFPGEASWWYENPGPGQAANQL